MLNKIIIYLIDLYQKTLSPDHGLFKKAGGYCKFTPTCSEYMKEAVARHGTFVGLAQGSYRIMRCNPWSKGGYDPVK